MTLPKHRQGCLTPSQPLVPRTGSPKNQTRTLQLTVHTAHPQWFSQKQTFFSSIMWDKAVGKRVGGSYLCRCIPQTGSSCAFSFHFNNACGNGSQARAFWESQRPLRVWCTNPSIVPLLKSLPRVVTPCVTQLQQHSSALTQLDINSWPVHLLIQHMKHARPGTNTHNYNLVYLVPKNVKPPPPSHKKRLSISNELSLLRLHNTTRLIQFHICLQTCKYCHGNSDIPKRIARFGTF